MSNQKILELFTSSILNTNEVDLSDVITSNSIDNLFAYKSNFFQGHINHLSNVYPCCEIVLGENNFKYFMSQYMTIRPPSNENLNEFGDDLFSFFESRSELTEIQYITFIAKLEWAIFDQNDEEIILPRGIYELWSALLNNEDPSNIEIDENIEEKIKFE
jgi:hypothetical protein